MVTVTREDKRLCVSSETVELAPIIEGRKDTWVVWFGSKTLNHWLDQGASSMRPEGSLVQAHLTVVHHEVQAMSLVWQSLVQQQSKLHLWYDNQDILFPATSILTLSLQIQVSWLSWKLSNVVSRSTITATCSNYNTHTLHYLVYFWSISLTL